MPRTIESCLFFLFTVTCLATARHCDHHHFWDSGSLVCRPCSRCPVNEIIHKPCGRHSDTVCRPFREFNDFKQLESLDPPYSSYDYELSPSKNSSQGDPDRDYLWRTGVLQNEPIVQKDDGEYWKNLAFALIGVVCVLIFVATVIVLLACRKLHETSAIKRPEEEDDDDSGYVVIRTIRPPNMVYRPLLPAHLISQHLLRQWLFLVRKMGALTLPSGAVRLPPKKGHTNQSARLLNYDADDVFESEDSSGSRTSRKVQLQPIPERSVSSDSDNVKSATHVTV